MKSKENTKHDTSLSKKIAALETINRVSLLISSKLELDKLLQFVVEEVADLFSASSCSILLPDDENRNLVFHAAVDPIVGMRVPLDKGIASNVYHTGIPQIANDLSANPDYYSNIEKDSGKPIHSVIAIPLFVDSEVIGVLEAINKNVGGFTQADQDLLVTLAGYAAIAIENARLYTDLQNHASNLEQLVIERTVELQTLYEKVKKLSVTDDLTGVYNRRGLMSMGEREVSRARRFGNSLAIILFDFLYRTLTTDSIG